MPQPSRRAALLFGAGTIGAGALSVGSLTPASAAPAAKIAAPVVPRRQAYQAGVGHEFVAQGAKRSFSLTLVEIADLVPATVVRDELSFNLIFHANGADDPPPGIYELRAAGVPVSTLYLSPFGLRAGPHRLQALVNRSS